MEVKLKNVSCVYDNLGIKKDVLDNVSYTFESSKITSIMGKNGTGKSTILRIINSLTKPSYGSVFIGNNLLGDSEEDDTINEISTRIGMVFQNSYDQFFCDTVRKELELEINLYNYRVKEKEKRLVESLTLVGLSEKYLDKKISELSRGEKKLLSLAVALICNPKILLLDEPSIGLDDEICQKIIRLIKLLKVKFKKTIIIASNDSDFVLKVSDNIIVLDNKKIVLEGDKYKVFSNINVSNYGIRVPDIIKIPICLYEYKKIHIGYRDEVNDVLKDIYRYVK